MIEPNDNAASDYIQYLLVMDELEGEKEQLSTTFEQKSTSFDHF